MTKIKNILFIMADQLRWDYLSCYGHPHLDTPNIDKLASKGLRFDRAYVQSPVCGPSRASTYTGRTVFSHGATWNRVPLPLGELTLGDYLRPQGVTTAVVGKTHMVPDREGMARLGVEAGGDIGIKVSQPGFDQRLSNNNPMEMAMQPEDLAGAYVYLSSRTDARAITGTILQVDAGSNLRWMRR